MKAFVLMNKETGEIGVGVKVLLFDDSFLENEIASLAGYSIQLRNQDFDGWLVAAEDEQPYIYAPKAMVEKSIEVLGEL